MNSLRARILAIVLGAGVIPVAIVAFWLADSAGTAGERVVRARIGASLDSVSRETADNWRALRYDLLFLAEDQAVRDALAGTRGDSRTHPASFDSMFASLRSAVTSATVHDSAGRVQWSVDRAAAGERELRVPISLPVRAMNGVQIGRIDFLVHYSALLDAQRSNHLFGGMYGLLDPASGLSYMPLPFSADLLANTSFDWGGDTWIVEKRDLHDPPLRVFAVAPATPFIAPLRHVARRGLLLLIFVVLGGAFTALLFTRHLSRSLESLSVAANRVAEGALDTRVVSDHGPSEVRDVATAFNTMSSNLRALLTRLSQQDALAAVGQFATELAHEVRNPLTAIRMDLELVEERLPEGSELRTIQTGVIEQIIRLDSTVTRALNVARSGFTELTPIPIGACIENAVRATMPRITERNVALQMDRADECVVRGDAAALQQLFANLLRNAADACGDGDSIHVAASCDNGVKVTVSDTGDGMSEATLSRVFEPMFTTKSDGTGVGLAIARRIADAHGASIEIDSSEGRGTIVTVSFPP